MGNNKHNWVPWLANSTQRLRNGCAACATNKTADTCVNSTACKWDSASPNPNCVAGNKMTMYQGVVNRWAQHVAQSPLSYIRGLLLVWTPGAGKTAAGISWLAAFPNKRCLVVSEPRVIRSNYDQWVQDGVNTLDLGVDEAVMQGVLSAVDVPTKNEKTQLPLTTARCQLRLKLRATQTASTAAQSYIVIVYARAIERTGTSTATPVTIGSSYSLTPNKTNSAVIAMNERCVVSVDGSLYEFSNNLKETSVIAWLKLCGTGPGLDYDPHFSGEDAYKRNGFLSYAQLHNAIESGNIDPNACAAVFDEVQWLTNPAHNNWREKTLRLRDWLVDGDERFKTFSLLTMSATPGETEDQFFKTLLMNHAPSSPVRQQVTAANLTFPLPPDSDEARNAALSIFRQLCRNCVSYVDASNARNVFPTAHFEFSPLAMPYVLSVEMGAVHKAEYAKRIRALPQRAWRSATAPYQESMDWLRRVRELVNVPDPHQPPENHPSDYRTPAALQSYCPKLYELWTRLAAYNDASGPGNAGVIRRNDRHFVSVPLIQPKGGWREVAAALRLCAPSENELPAFVEWNPGAGTPPLRPGQKYFVCYTGGNSPENAKALKAKLQFFNGGATSCVIPNNINEQGAYDPPCTVFVASGGFNEMYSLCRTRYLHVWGAFPYKREMMQMLGRPVRQCSHALEPLKRWDVFVLVYLTAITDSRNIPDPDGTSAGATVQSHLGCPLEKCASTPNTVWDASQKRCIPEFTAVPLRSPDGGVQCYAASSIANVGMVNPITGAQLTPEEKESYAYQTRSGPHRARVGGDDVSSGETSGEQNALQQLAHMLVSKSPDEYVFARMMLHQSTRDYFMQAIREESIDCRLLSQFHGMSESACHKEKVSDTQRQAWLGKNEKDMTAAEIVRSSKNDARLGRSSEGDDAYNVGYVSPTDWRRFMTHLRFIAKDAFALLEKGTRDALVPLKQNLAARKAAAPGRSKRTLHEDAAHERSGGARPADIVGDVPQYV